MQNLPIYVWFDNEEVDVPVFMGTLTASLVRGHEVFSFDFDTDWLKYKQFRNFDPDLQLYSGRQFPSAEKCNFGIFLDSAPDRWGRVLLDRREAIVAKEEKRQVRNLRENLVELFRRIAFNVAISNCDDHLRNHGFLYSKSGWMLSPAYDLNPDPFGEGLSLNINQSDNSLDFGTVLGVATYLGIKEKESERIVADVRDTVSHWRGIANGLGISRTEQDFMASAFAAK